MGRASGRGKPRERGGGPQPVRHVKRVGAVPKGVRMCGAGPSASSGMTRGGPRGTGRVDDDGGREAKGGRFLFVGWRGPRRCVWGERLDARVRCWMDSGSSVGRGTGLQVDDTWMR